MRSFYSFNIINNLWRKQIVKLGQELRVIQIIPVTKPLVAVFRCDSDIDPDEFYTLEVYAIELVEDKDKNRFERGVTVDTICQNGKIENVEEYSDFIGYAKNDEDAFKLYSKKR